MLSAIQIARIAPKMIVPNQGTNTQRLSAVRQRQLSALSGERSEEDERCAVAEETGTGCNGHNTERRSDLPADLRPAGSNRRSLFTFPFWSFARSGNDHFRTLG
jgi:hypothetical protein